MLRYQSDVSFEPNVGPKSTKRVSFNDKDIVIFLPEYGTTQFTSNRTSPARLILGSHQPGGENIVGGRFKTFAGSRGTPLRRTTSVSSLPFHDKTPCHEVQDSITASEDVALKSILKKPKKLTSQTHYCRVPTERRANYFESTIPRTAPSYRLGELGFQDDYDKTRKREATSFEFDSRMDSSKTSMCSPSWKGKNSFENKMCSRYKTQGSITSYSDKFVVSDDNLVPSNLSPNRNYRSPTSNYADRGTITFSRSFPGITSNLIQEKRSSKEFNPSRDLTVQGSPVTMLDLHPSLSEVRKTLDNISATRNDALSKSEVPTNLHSLFPKESSALEHTAHSGQGLLSRSYTSMYRASVPYSTALLNKTGTTFESGSGSQESFVTHTSSSSATPYASSLYLKTGNANSERNFSTHRSHKVTPEAGVKTFRTATPYASPNRTSSFASYENYSPSTAWLNERMGGNSFDRRFGHLNTARPHTSQLSRTSSDGKNPLQTMEAGFRRRPGTSSYR